EVALASRDLASQGKPLEAAIATLEAHGDELNAAYARYIEVRRLLLIGRIEAAERLLAKLDPAQFPPVLKTAHHLVIAGIAMRRTQAKVAREALASSVRAAYNAGIPALMAEVQNAMLMLDTPVARLIANGSERPLFLDDAEALFASKTL